MNTFKQAIAAGAAIALGALLASPVKAATEAELYAAAKKEGEVVWYTGLIQNLLVRPMVSAFEAKYPGIKVTIAGGISSDLTLKILEEAKAGVYKADLNTPARFLELDKAGLVAVYHPENAKKLPAAIKDPNGKWTSILNYYFTTAVNTELVKEADIPKKIEDLLDPKWKGKMAWVASLGAASGPGFAEAIRIRMGVEKGNAFLKKFAEQNIIKVPSNQRVVLDQVIAGQYPIGLLMFHHHAHISADKGAPVKYLPLDPILQTSEVIILLKNAPHPNAAKLLLEFILSPDGAKIISDAMYVPADPNVKSIVPIITEASNKQAPIFYSREIIDTKTDEWIAKYQEIFK